MFRIHTKQQGECGVVYVGEPAVVDYRFVNDKTTAEKLLIKTCKEVLSLADSESPFARTGLTVTQAKARLQEEMIDPVAA